MAVDDAVAGLKVAMALNDRAVEVDHALDKIVNQRELEGVIQLNLFILQYILEGGGGGGWAMRVNLKDELEENFD